ncbi:DUF192 domain-containing protein [Denitratisoma oestradiolicum]|uniref:DUF192 domain-containing protein n=1 Tax=Denitratisoma oestradiolicum TaxID=311182 RepID=A0A6S6Y584_9PROT|nr:DUF192 domain-containing protein [Denitratisoma oestradiolicum]TWO81082.1 hypothetical protein CBW56_05600 [Denitratisoma oestradiolicum]CAB1367758.1 conserved exported protein of unknown function [Denitratisoma oestradiolicum]
MNRLLCLAAFLTSTFPAWGQQSLPLLELSAGIHRIEAEVAATQAQRMKGLMQRRTMAPNHGMLFVFTAQERHCMWMKNTLLPLAVAFLDEQGRILNVAEMTPGSEENHCATAPARYALEMNSGWFKARGFAAGTAIRGLDKAPVAQ